MSDIRAVFGKRRDPGLFMGRSAGQLVVLIVALFSLVMFVRSLTSPPALWWALVVGLFVAPFAFLRVGGRPIPAVGPSMAANAILGWLGLRRYMGGPYRRQRADSVQYPPSQPRLPGMLSRLSFESYQAGNVAGAVGIVVDRTDGTWVAVLEVTGPTFPLLDTEDANAYTAAFGRLLDSLARPDSPVVGIQILERVLPDFGEDAVREWRRRGTETVPAAVAFNEAILEAAALDGIGHQSLIAVRVRPALAKGAVKEFGGGEAARAAITYRALAELRTGLERAGVTVRGVLPPRAIAAVIRSAFDPSADAMVARRGGGLGDTSGGDLGLPSGVSPLACGPMAMEPARSYVRHNDWYSRTWWVEEFPRSRDGVPTGFLQPVLLNLRHRHTVSIVLEPVGRRAAERAITEEVSRQDAKAHMDRKTGRRRSRADQREESDLDRREIDLVEGFSNFKIVVVVTASAPTLGELERVSADISGALNQCSMEARVWYWETDQAFVMGALPLVRGIG